MCVELGWDREYVIMCGWVGLNGGERQFCVVRHARVRLNGCEWR